jgi:hypothetical protein
MTTIMDPVTRGVRDLESDTLKSNYRSQIKLQIQEWKYRRIF